MKFKFPPIAEYITSVAKHPVSPVPIIPAGNGTPCPIPTFPIVVQSVCTFFSSESKAESVLAWVANSVLRLCRVAAVSASVDEAVSSD